MRTWRSILGLSLVALSLSACAKRPDRNNPSLSAEARAIAFLEREVPGWSRENGCFSCHNNGDAARALFAASQKGYRIPESALADTLQWVGRPERWDDNQGDPGFSDKRLADVQFAATLVAALEAGLLKDRPAMKTAALRVISGQADDGSWPIDVSNPAGSPATYGLSLATFMAWDLLKNAATGEAFRARTKAEQSLKVIKPSNVPNAAVLLLYLAKSGKGKVDERQASTGQGSVLAESLAFLKRAQSGDGGWGPYADSPPEAFDTSLALLALAELSPTEDVLAMIQQGRHFLISAQLPDGSWPASTRPSGGVSYAQQISTSGWATLALLATR